MPLVSHEVLASLRSVCAAAEVRPLCDVQHPLIFDRATCLLQQPVDDMGGIYIVVAP